MRSRLWLSVCAILTLSMVFSAKQSGSTLALAQPQSIQSSRIVTDYKNPRKADNQSFALAPDSWQEIKYETFEWPFPNSGWTVTDLSNDGYERKWDDDNYRRHAGSKAAWPARGGANGLDPTSTNHYYFNNMYTRMAYGPFDLSDAKKAEVKFWLWREIQNNYDYIALEVSDTGAPLSYQEIARWTGNAGWEQKVFSLNDYLGVNTVYVAWRFYSNATNNNYDGPWVDDILIQKYVPTRVTANGTLMYWDRNNNHIPGAYTGVSLYDQDPGGSDDLLYTRDTNSDGFFQFPSIMNWDDDDPDPDPNNRLLDLYVVWETDKNNSSVAPRRVVGFDGGIYNWPSEVHTNAENSVENFSYDIPNESDKERAMWIFQDLRRAWDYVRNNTGRNPGSVTALWEKNQNSYIGINNSFFYGGPGDPLIFIADDSSISSDTVVHETGHHYMWNATNWWWWHPNCWSHDFFSQEDANCAWSEGWADFLPLVVNDDQCYDLGPGPCGFDNYPFKDLETPTWGDNRPQGDVVEGRVAGALYDLFDSQNEGYDSADFGFDPIADIVFNGTKERFYEFWNSWWASGNNNHHALRAIYQNTIDYDTPPTFDPPLDNVTALQSLTRPHAIHLWAYATDNESMDTNLTFQIVSVSDVRCGVGLESNRWINLTPQQGWLGSCYVTVRVSDSLKTADGGFWVNVVPVQGRMVLPLIFQNSP